jgi:hypothetical protein
MSEDIVARLREQADRDFMNYGGILHSAEENLLREAADEIEKLKEMLAHMGRRLEEKDREIERR